MGFKNYIKELNRRNVVKAGLAYLVIAWLVIQVLSILLPTFNASPSILKTIIIIMIIGFPIWLVFAWIFELTPEGIKKTDHIDNVIDKTITKKTDIRLNRIIIGSLSIIIILLIGNQVRMYQFDKDGIPNFTSVDDRMAIAVLPLYNLTGNADQDYLVDGMHDALIGDLGQISALRVISRTSTLRYKKNSQLSLQEIAKELDVKAIVEGSVLSSNDSIHIQLKLIEAFPQERQLWSQEYAQNVGKVLSMENRIIQDIAKKIEVNLNPEEEHTLSKSPEVNPEAYKAYMQGLFYWNKLTSEDLDTALKYFEIAREIDPDFALAYSGIASVWLGKAQQGLVSYAESNTIIENNIAKALAMDSTSADIYNIKAGILCWGDYNYEASEKAYRRSIKLNPNLSIARAYFSQVLVMRHKPEEAMQQIEIALKLDPFNSLYKALYGMNLNNTRQFDKAIKILEPTLISSPHDPVALSTLRTSYHMKGMYAKAIEIWKASYDVKNDIEAIEVLSKGYKDGGYQKSLENLALLLIKRSDSMYVTPWQIATLYTRAGKKDNALKWLEKAYDQHDGNMTYIGVDPIFDILKGDPRFSNLLKKMNLSVENK